MWKEGGAGYKWAPNFKFILTNGGHIKNLLAYNIKCLQSFCLSYGWKAKDVWFYLHRGEGPSGLSDPLPMLPFCVSFLNRSQPCLRRGQWKSLPCINLSPEQIVARQKELVAQKQAKEKAALEYKKKVDEWYEKFIPKRTAPAKKPSYSYTAGHLKIFYDKWLWDRNKYEKALK